MTVESSTASSGSGTGEPSPDKYIGSLISLTSKSEIRYEGILYNINTHETSIGLCNVRSYGTEGRKTADGLHVPQSDRVYEYILFRGSDIKDLQVKKTSSPAQAAPPSINSDPAIIQSHFPGATVPPTTSLPTAPSTHLTNLGSHSSQMGPTFQSGLPLYQPGGNMNTWGAASPNIPMYYPGFYGTSNGITQMPQQSSQPPPQGFSFPPSLNMQFPGFDPSLPISSTLPSSNLPEYHSLVPNSTNTSNLTSSSLPMPSFSLNAPPLQPMPLPSETMLNFLPNKAPTPTITTSVPSSSLPSWTPLSVPVPHNAPVHSSVSKPIVTTGPSALASQTLSSRPARTESAAPSLITPAELLQPAPQSLPTAQKDVEVVQESPKRAPEQSVPVVTEAQPPILPLPTNARPYKPNGDSYHNVRNHYRGRGARGPGGRVPGARGPGISHPLDKFTEEFDFTAMNEKFNKDEVWGHLGKSNKYQSNDKDENNFDSHEEYPEGEHDSDLPTNEIKPVYKKDDFFDSLSSNALDIAQNYVRPKYSELLKLDTETFGEFSRSRGGRGGGRFRGSYLGGRGYDGYGDRGRGHGGYGDGGRGRGGYGDGGRGRGGYGDGGHGRGGYGDGARGRGGYGDGGRVRGGYGDGGRGRGGYGDRGRDRGA